MKKITITIALTSLLNSATAQTLFLRRDTAILKSQECNWLMPLEFKIDSVSTISEWFVCSIQKGKMQAVDCITGENIPGQKILYWNMPADTVAVGDGVNVRFDHFVVTQHEIDPSKITRIKIQQDWYLDASSGKLFSRINFIDLMIELNDPLGMFLGYKFFCRINY